MLTSPITNDHFHTRVLGLLNSYTQNLSDAPQAQSPLPLVPALDHPDTPLGPSDTIGQLLVFTSPWIDLSSPDPVIAHLSRQVFHLEIAYAAFCGATNIVVAGPRLAHGQDGVSRFARAVKEALGTASYAQLHIQLPMDGTRSGTEVGDLGDLARFARSEYVTSKHSKDSNAWSSWDAWNTVRSICKYNSRLAIGTNHYIPLHSFISSITIRTQHFLMFQT
jgi:type II protein arginine methyltransferase